VNLLASMRYLVALSEHRHFGRAAEACHITQPALSNAVRALEQEFKVVIVQRGRAYAGLTLEGERVLATAHRMLREHRVLEQELGSPAHRPRGPLRMGAVPSAVPVLARFATLLQVQHPSIVPEVRTMTSREIETGLENLSLDLALGYTGRMNIEGNQLCAWPQYTEHYFLLRRAAQPHADELQIGAKIRWKEAAKLPLALMFPDMHNRAIIDGAFAAAGARVKPALETNSVLALAMSALEGGVCTVLPGALIDAVRGYRQLEALPLTSPDVCTPIGFMGQASVRPSRVMEAALVLAQDPAWLRHAAAHSGMLPA
jgi:DNA-binding transcriptional LysR family regulator